jgi:hypothetical protein
MNDYEKFWTDVFIAAIRSGVNQGMATSFADDALEKYKRRCKDQSFFNAK